MNGLTMLSNTERQINYQVKKMMTPKKDNIKNSKNIKLQNKICLQKQKFFSRNRDLQDATHTSNKLEIIVILKWTTEQNNVTSTKIYKLILNTSTTKKE